jgi:hypothetical protein
MDIGKLGSHLEAENLLQIDRVEAMFGWVGC